MVSALETVIRELPEVKLWSYLEEINAKYAHSLRAPVVVELELYDAFLKDLKRRGATKLGRYEHELHSFYGMKKTERL